MIPKIDELLANFPPHPSAWDFCEEYLNPPRLLDDKKKRAMYVKFLMKVLGFSAKSKHLYSLGEKFEEMPLEHLETLGFAYGLSLRELQSPSKLTPQDFLETIIVTNPHAKQLWTDFQKDFDKPCCKIIAASCGLALNQVENHRLGSFPKFNKLSDLKKRRLQLLTLNVRSLLYSRVAA